MENFQHKINLMKQQINTIRSDIESIATENNNNNNNYITSTNYSTPSNPLFTTNSHHKSHSPNFNKSSIKTKYIHRKNSHSQHYNLLFKTNNALLSDYNSANRNETFQKKLPITSNSMFMNHKTNKIYKPNDNMNIRHKKGKSVIMSNTSRGCNDIELNSNSNDVVKELIDITNKYCEDKNECVDNKEVTPGFVVENYKRLLKENAMYREFIKNISKLYKNKMGNNCNLPTTNTDNNSNTVIELWKWINYISHNDNTNTYTNNNNNKYQQYCEQIMFEHNLQTFNDFTSFINHLLNKSTKNETFLDGIKKLLLVNNKIDTYPQ